MLYKYIIYIFFFFCQFIFPMVKGWERKIEGTGTAGAAAADFMLWDHILGQCKSVLYAAMVAQAVCYYGCLLALMHSSATLFHLIL